MKNILFGLFALLALSSAGFAQYYNSCEKNCCEVAGGGYWDSSDGTCTEPSSQSSYFDCSMNCDEETSYMPTSAEGYVPSGSSSCCCGSAAVLLLVDGAAFFSRRS